MSKRPDAPSTSENSSATPIKRVKVETEGGASSEAGPSTILSKSEGGDNIVSSSPAPGRDTDSPSHRAGNRGKRGKKDGGRGGGRDRGNRDGPDSRSWGGRSDNAKGGMRTWGKKDENEVPVNFDEKKERYPKKKVAMLVGYNGVGYFGSQINPGFDTVEGEIFAACIKAGAISEDNSVNPQKVALGRAARTDAGVCAAVNVLSLKLILAPPNLPEGMPLEDYINTFLPSSVRVWSILRVQGGFDPRHSCDQRHYEYTVPTHVFLGPKPGTVMADWIKSSRAAHDTTDTTTTTQEESTTATEDVKVEVSSTDEPKPVESIAIPTAEESTTPSSPEDIAMASSAAFWAAQAPGSTFASDCQARKAWRISPELLNSARSFVKAFEGSHNYYNFTVGKDFRDRSCQRIMRELKISEPFIVNETEFVAVTFLGQSFMLHQIRKMIGTAILAIRTSTPPSLIPETFGPSRIHTPKAPALGLLLLEPQYVEYNKRLVESNLKLLALAKDGKLEDKLAEDQIRDPVMMGEGELKVKVDEFKSVEVYKKMWEIEENGSVFANWLNYLDVHTGPDFHYLNSKGIIPEIACFKKGENPEKVRSAKGALVVPGAPEDDEPLAGAEEEG